MYMYVEEDMKGSSFRSVLLGLPYWLRCIEGFGEAWGFLRRIANRLGDRLSYAECVQCTWYLHQVSRLTFVLRTYLWAHKHWPTMMLSFVALCSIWRLSIISARSFEVPLIMLVISKVWWIFSLFFFLLTCCNVLYMLNNSFALLC